MAFVVIAVVGVFAFNGGQQAWATYQDNRNQPEFPACPGHPEMAYPCLSSGP